MHGVWELTTHYHNFEYHGIVRGVLKSMGTVYWSYKYHPQWHFKTDKIQCKTPILHTYLPSNLENIHPLVLQKNIYQPKINKFMEPKLNQVVAKLKELKQSD
jgi:hypothetical protein